MFQLHPQLVSDCHQLGRLPVCHLLLHKNAGVPWFILVPETATVDLLDLSIEMRTQVMTEAAAVGEFVKNHFGVPRLNFAAIGNLVPQMHLHVVGRSPDDPCWPQPVWGNLQSAETYSPSQVAEITGQLRQRCQFVTDSF